MIVDSFSSAADGHFMAITVMVPDDRLEDYFITEILRRRNSTHLIPKIKAAQLPDRVKENLLLNIELRRQPKV